MTKAELIDSLHTQFEGQVTKKLTAQMLDATFAGMAASIKKEQRFYYPDFGTFDVRKRKARVGRNPQTGATLKIKASKSVGFRASRKLRDTL